MKQLLLSLVFVLSLAGPARATDYLPAADDPVHDYEEGRMQVGGVEVVPLYGPVSGAELESRTMELAKGLRCPVCQGMSVADSSAEAAVNMKSRIEDLVRQGYSDEQVVDYFVDRYGTWIMLEPEAEGVNWLIFIGPVVLLLVGAGAAWWTVRRGPTEAPAAPGQEPAAREEEEDPDDEYERRVLAELED